MQQQNGISREKKGKTATELQKFETQSNTNI